MSFSPKKTTKKPKLVLFDLDGTLCDTRKQSLATLNDILQAHELPPMKVSDWGEVTIEQWVEKHYQLGIKGFSKYVKQPQEVAKLRKVFWDRHLKRDSTKDPLYPGVPEVISFLGSQGIPWGIASNNVYDNVCLIKENKPVLHACCCVVTADVVKAKKPDPSMLLAACRQVSICPEDTLYVGDSAIDIQAAQAIGMPVVFVSYGYGEARAQKADLSVDSMWQLKEWLESL